MRKILVRLLEILLGGTTMHSRYFEKVKKWYGQGLWTIDMVFAAVPKMITIDEYKEITGQEYEFDSVD